MGVLGVGAFGCIANRKSGDNYGQCPGDLYFSCTIMSPAMLDMNIGEISTRRRRYIEAESPITRRAVGIVAADLLRERLQADESSVIGVGFGRTIAEVPSCLVGMSYPKAKCVSAMGSLTRSSAATPSKWSAILPKELAKRDTFCPCRLSQIA